MLDRRAFLGALAAMPFIAVGCQRKAERPTLKAGDPLPVVELPAMDGRAYALLPDSGPFLINFWATWCRPCRLEMKSLDRAHEALGPRGLKVIGISVDSDIFLVREYLLQERIKFPILFDRESVVASTRFMVTAYPSSFLVDAAGRIAEIWLGGRDWEMPEIRTSLERVL